MFFPIIAQSFPWRSQAGAALFIFIVIAQSFPWRSQAEACLLPTKQSRSESFWVEYWGGSSYLLKLRRSNLSFLIRRGGQTPFELSPKTKKKSKRRDRHASLKAEARDDKVGCHCALFSLTKSSGSETTEAISQFIFLGGVLRREEKQKMRLPPATPSARGFGLLRSQWQKKRTRNDTKRGIPMTDEMVNKLRYMRLLSLERHLQMKIS